MNKGLTINIETNEIILSKAFRKKSSVYNSPEYQELQNCRRDNPTFKVIIRSIKKAEGKETYKGLTYEYMKNYIKSHANADKNMAEYKELRLLSECHKIRYAVIKNWFLDAYPEVKQYGVKAEEQPTVIQMPEINQTEEKIS